MNNLYVKCESLEQRQNVFDVLNSEGFDSWGKVSASYFNVTVLRKTNEYLVNPNGNTNDRPEITYNQFMEKYGNTMNEFKKVVAKACHELSVSEAELSRMLGFSRNYINQAILEGRSTKWQESTIVKIEGLLKGVVFDKFSVKVNDEVSPKSHNMIIDIGASFNPEFKALLADEKSQVEKIIKENTQLKKDKEQLVIHNGNLSDENARINEVNFNLQSDKAKLVTQVNNERKVVENLHSNINEIIEENKLKISSLMGESDKYFRESQKLRLDKDGLKGKIRSLEKINAQYKNKYAASVIIGLMIASVLICVILWGGM